MYRFVVWCLLMMGPFFGCSEYDLLSKQSAEEPMEETAPEEEPPPGLDPEDPDAEGPELSVLPDVIDLGVLCGEGEGLVTLKNVGVGDLEIQELVVAGTSWWIAHEELPVVLTTDQTFPVYVTGSGGSSVLRIVTNDPDVPERTVPLHAEQDTPPTIRIDSPSSAAILDVGVPTDFLASVSDDADDLETMTIDWVSDVDGTLGTSLANAAGLTSFRWLPEEWNTGIHTVSAHVTDSCGNTAVAEVGFCQNEGYTEDSIDLASWNFEGTAMWDAASGWVELTGPYTDQAGTAFQTTTTVSSDAVNIEFSFYVSGGTGADGMSLTALDADRMSSFVGSSGGGIGYAGLPGWSIEIDTWYNSVHNDPTTEDHLSVHFDGDVGSPVTWATLPDMEDGLWHLANIEVRGSHMTVSIDGVDYIDQEISGLTTFPAYVGFTGATGSVTNYHLIDALEVEGFICEE
jgi:hypothetical protein